MKQTTAVVVAAILAGAIGLGGCASKEPAEPKAEKPVVMAPAGSPLSKISPGMTDVDVRKAIGEPTRSRSYMTGKQFIPWYFGSDTSRMAWVYAGQGEVVFSRNQYSGGLKVIRVDYDPSVQ